MSGKYSKEILDQDKEDPAEEGMETIAEIEKEESVYARLKVRMGGKAPVAELECRITVSLDKISEVPDMVADTMDKIYTKAQEKNLLF